MYCQKCGAHLKAGTKFCTQCGAPQYGSPRDASPEHLEYCEIQCVGDGHFWETKSRFEATGIGVKGIETFAFTEAFKVSADYPDSQTKDREIALNKLIEYLQQAGWEPIGQGQRWYSYKFHRIIH